MFIDNSKELAQYKLLILYILENSEIPLNNSEITQFLLENNYMNYFLAQQFISELVNSKFIEFSIKDGQEYYHLSKAGKDTLFFFSDRIPQSLKEEIDKKFEKKKEEMVKDSQIIGNYFKKSDSEYIVTLKVIEKDITLFNLSLNVVSNKQAKNICNNWKKNSHKIYKQILDLFIDE